MFYNIKKPIFRLIIFFLCFFLRFCFAVLKIISIFVAVLKIICEIKKRMNYGN